MAPPGPNSDRQEREIPLERSHLHLCQVFPELDERVVYRVHLLEKSEHLAGHSRQAVLCLYGLDRVDPRCTTTSSSFHRLEEYLRDPRTTQQDVRLVCVGHLPDHYGVAVEHFLRLSVFLLLVLDRRVPYFPGWVHVPDALGATAHLLFDHWTGCGCYGSKP